MHSMTVVIQSSPFPLDATGCWYVCYFCFYSLYLPVLGVVNAGSGSLTTLNGTVERLAHVEVGAQALAHEPSSVATPFRVQSLTTLCSLNQPLNPSHLTLVSSSASSDATMAPPTSRRRARSRADRGRSVCPRAPLRGPRQTRRRPRPRSRRHTIASLLHARRHGRLAGARRRGSSWAYPGAAPALRGYPRPLRP